MGCDCVCENCGSGGGDGLWLCVWGGMHVNGGKIIDEIGGLAWRTLWKSFTFVFQLIQLSSVAQLYPTLWPHE